MRNWNSWPSHLAQHGFCLLPAYLWGIETQVPSSNPPRHPLNCQPTYEELKPSLTKWLKSGLKNCQPTYEELKHWTISRYAYYPNNCQPTYEELKRRWAGLMNIKCLNCQPTYEELKRRKEGPGCWHWSWLPAYLWGIETAIWRLQSGRCDWLPAYLWGIETDYKYKLRVKAGEYCQPTYEELKQTNYIGLSLGPQLLPAYLWGIETHNDIENPSWNLLIASLPMRNWNDLAGFGALRDTTHCQPTYEELKLEQLTQSIWESEGIASLPMRNWN